jgi:hypothetical protein
MPEIAYTVSTAMDLTIFDYPLSDKEIEGVPLTTEPEISSNAILRIFPATIQIAASFSVLRTA